MAARKTTATPAATHENLDAAILAIQKGMPAFQRDAVNPHFGSSYLNLETLLPQVVEVITANGCTVTQWPGHDGNGRGTLKTIITHVASRESKEGTMLLSAGKETPQAQGSAITYAKRYALMAILGITADKDDDGNAGSYRGSSAAQTAQVAVSPAPTGTEGTDPFTGGMTL